MPGDARGEMAGAHEELDAPAVERLVDGASFESRSPCCTATRRTTGREAAGRASRPRTEP